MRPLRFHWRVFPGETRLPFVDLCLQAEENGLESIDVPRVGALTTAVATQTAHIKLRIGCDDPSIQEIQRSRLIIHVKSGCAADVAGLREICSEVHVEGQTAEAAFLAIQQGNVLWRLPDRPNQVYADALPVLHFGKEVGLVSSIVARATRPAALEAAASFLPPDALDRWNDPSAWITPYLWTGAVPGWGPESAIIVGSFEEVAQSLYGFKKNGISQFLFLGWPDEHEMNYVGVGVLARVRALEHE